MMQEQLHKVTALLQNAVGIIVNVLNVYLRTSLNICC